MNERGTPRDRVVTLAERGDRLYKESAGGSLANGFLHAQARSRIQWDERESSPVGGRGFRRGRGVAQPDFTG